MIWWENTSGDGSTWSEATVDSVFGGATSVYAGDIDADVSGLRITLEDDEALEAEIADQSNIAERHCLAVDRARHAFARDSVEIGGLRHCDPPLLGAAHEIRSVLVTPARFEQLAADLAVSSCVVLQRHAGP